MNPHGGALGPHLNVRGFPVVEHQDLIWIWMGDEAKADPALIPDISTGNPVIDRRTRYNYLNTNYRHDILVDNLLDLSHADYLHAGSLTGGPCERADMRDWEEDNNQVVIERITYRQLPAPFSASVGDMVDMKIRIRWFPGQVTKFYTAIFPAGGKVEDGIEFNFNHFITPESAHKAHYYMSNTRGFGPDDDALDERFGALQRLAVDTEDGPMLSAVDERMGDTELMELHPAILACDTGAMRVRRVMKRLLAEDGRQSVAA